MGTSPRSLGAARGSGSSLWFGSAPKELQPLLQAMRVARVLKPASKLVTHRMLHEDTATSSLVACWAWANAAWTICTGRWTGCTRQPAVERRLARQHLVGSTLVLYDLSSTWLTGAAASWSRGVVLRATASAMIHRSSSAWCAHEGRPIAVEVFKGNTADPATVAQQVLELKQHSASAQ